MKPYFPRAIRRYFLAASAILLLCAQHTAAQDTPPPDADTRSAAARDSESDRHECVIESERYDVEISRNFGKRTTVTSSLLITERKGSRYTFIRIPYQKGDKIDIHYARIEDMNGNVIRKLRGSDIHETQAIHSGAIYQDYFIKYFQLLHNRHPYRLVYSYSTTQRNYISLIDIADSGSCPIQESIVTLTVPEEEVGKIDIRCENVPDPETAKHEGAIRYTWKYSYDPLRPEVMSHSESLGIPRIIVNPERFEYGVEGSLASWENYGNWYHALNEGLDELPDYEKANIDHLLADVEDDLDKMKMLYHYLQDRNRYVNVSMDIGGMKSYPASYVSANRYGDCKALTTYMKAMLNYVGIRSHMALIWLGEGHPRIDSDFPCQSAFNHVINVVPYRGDTIYLECTSKNNPFGYVHPQIQGRQALLARESGSHLTDIPAVGPEDAACHYDYNIAMDAEGNASVHIESVLRGEHRDLFSALANEFDKTIADKYIRDRLFSGNFELLDYKIVPAGRDVPEVAFTADLAVNGFGREYGRNAVITNFPIHLPPFERPEKRKSAVEITMPLSEEYTLTYDMPSVRPGDLSASVTVETKYGTYSIAYSATEGGLVVRKSILLKAGVIPLEEYPDFYGFISQIRREEKSKLIINTLSNPE